MRKIKLILSFLGLGILALAQTNTLYTTYLTAAISPPGTSGVQNICFTVNSTTNINAPTLSNGPFGGSQSTVGSYLFIDGEMIQTQTVSSGSSTVCGWRGVNGTAATGHQANALVLIGNGDWFSGKTVAQRPSGTCVLGNIYAYPDVHTSDGTWWGCRSDGIWGFAGPGLAAFGAPVNRTTATTTYTATYWDYEIAVNTTSAAFTLTLPAANEVPGKVYFIVDEGGDAGTNNLTVTTAHGCASIAANYGACRVISNGTAWYAF
jgi:hypothetical protein